MFLEVLALTLLYTKNIALCTKFKNIFFNKNVSSLYEFSHTTKQNAYFLIKSIVN